MVLGQCMRPMPIQHCEETEELLPVTDSRVGAKVMTTIFFHKDTSPVEKCDTYRRKDAACLRCHLSIYRSVLKLKMTPGEDEK